jgi:hypothetical protein
MQFFIQKVNGLFFVRLFSTLSGIFSFFDKHRIATSPLSRVHLTFHQQFFFKIIKPASIGISTLKFEAVFSTFKGFDCCL